MGGCGLHSADRIRTGGARTEFRIQMEAFELVGLPELRP
jgi:hypothetical protein